MIIDAWRLTFLSENMKYLTGLLDSGDACRYQLRVHPPTVTMPRIKAMTSGSIPSFIDVVLNLGSSEMKTDTILHQFRAKDDKIVFYGDNTWTNMFPGMFHRYVANQDSLFVNDFYEGDRNITKRLKSELRNSDWKMVRMHVLVND
jgi:ethanolamine phosphate transferase 2 subunit G